jgi:hypothetical protein
MSSSILKRIFSPQESGFDNELEIFSKPCCKQMCCHPGFVNPFTDHRKRKFSVMLKALGFSGWQMSIGFTLTPNKRVGLSFEAWKADVDLFSVVIQGLNGIFF